MGKFGEYVRGLVILSALFALSLGAAVAEDAPISVGINIAKIIGVNYMGADQWSEVANEGTGSMDLTGWTLKNMKGQTYSFPANFTLEAGSIVKVHAGKGNNKATDLYNSSLLWNRDSDTATLKDATGKTISEYKYPIEVSAPVSRTKTTTDNPLYLSNTFSIEGTSQPFLPDYKSNYSAERGVLRPNSPVNLTGHSFICHGGPLNWAWTSGLR